METNYFARLNQINVSEHLEKKGDFSYLSWPYAVAQLRLADPTRLLGGPPLRRPAVPQDRGRLLRRGRGHRAGRHARRRSTRCWTARTGRSSSRPRSTSTPVDPALPGQGDRAARPRPLRLRRRGPARRRERQADAAQGAGGIRSPAARSPPAQLRYIERLIDEAGSDLGTVLDYFGVSRTDRAQQPRGESTRHQVAATSQAEGSMSTIVKLVQGSAEWHEHRRKSPQRQRDPHRPGRFAVADAVPALAAQARARRAGGHPGDAARHAARAGRPGRLRGPDRARDAAAGPGRRRVLGEPGRPDAWLASASSRSSARSRAATRRCGRPSKRDACPSTTSWQVQHQLMVTKADVADVFVFDGSEGILFPVAPDPSTWPQIHDAWDDVHALRHRQERAAAARIATREYATIPSGSRRPRRTLKRSARRTRWRRRWMKRRRSSSASRVTPARAGAACR